MTSFVTTAGYAALALAAIALQVLATRVSGTRLRPVQAYVAALMRSTPGRWLVLVLWVWAGWHFFVR
jgi:uncharacterized protein DUF6186